MPPAGTRPTSDRAREGLFSALQSMLGSLEGTRVLDLYAGSGAVGLEAASRGAVEVVLVENDPKAVGILTANVAVVGAPGVRVVRDSVERFLRSRDGGPPGSSSPSYDIVFLDPPYSMETTGLRSLVATLPGRWVSSGGVVVVERATRDGDWQWPEGLEPDRERRYGEGTLWYGRAA